MKNQSGIDVVAICDSNEKVINVYGWGKMIGSIECPEFGGMKIPKIILENGQVIWGYQCWWCSQEQFENEVQDGRKIKIVPFEEEE